jgi:hypothetical protein
MRSITCSLALAAMVATQGAPALAHHGWSGYDSSKEMTLTGGHPRGGL